jgi:ABC-type multidrug transport system fused ATPase/permease subunit
MRNISYLLGTMGFAFRQSRMWYVYIAASMASILFELGALTLLMPLSKLASGVPVSGTSLSIRILHFLHLPVDAGALLLLFLGFFAIRIVTLFGTQALNSHLSRQLMAQLATRAFRNLVMNVPLRQIEHKSIGSYISLVGDESFRASMIVSNVSNAFSIFALAVVYYVVILVYSQMAALAILAFLVLTFIALTGSFRYSHRLGDRQSELARSASSIFLDALNGLRSVRAFSSEAYVSDTYWSRMRQYVHTLIQLDVVALAAKLGPAILLLVLLAGAVVIPSVGGRIFADLSLLITVMLMIMRLFPLIGQILIFGMKIVADARVGRDVTHLAERSAIRAVPDVPIAALLRPVREIVVDGIDYSHDGKPLLRKLSLQFCKGNSYAIVGPSGSGKSTFFDLLLRFCEPQAGAIRHNGIDASVINERQLREKIILVSQDVTIFNDTVRNNVTFGIERSAEDVRLACQIACIHDFIESLERGYDTPLNYRGTNFSGGQKQRIGISRALVRAPDVLLLDECTSALDPEVREQVVSNLLERFRDGIIIFITHDDWLVRQVDEVFDFRPVAAKA